MMIIDDSQRDTYPMDLSYNMLTEKNVHEKYVIYEKYVHEKMSFEPPI